ncbi:hypothetical protein BDP27DRAFT_1358453 [Rhodocollybia butyracea]|uniref:Uncharacterized protein n=1 Tax=Rhodocollybia butyracea TaxID=206335 RepID=A0A9P5Q0G6_9AGAR|nr:hypothetical protein BDP27DRAFT_1358453 [Rhodocollybia butyracea]
MNEYASPKRVQTDDIHASNTASNVPSTLSHGLDPDITAALRNIGMRTRKSVLEGYAINSESPRMKAMSMSTANFFHSPRDDPMGARIISPRKRCRSASPIDNGTDACNGEDSMRLDARGHPERPVKPLKRTGRPFTQTQSLPAGALFPGQSQTNNQGNPRRAFEEEEDWSADLTPQPEGEASMLLT